MSLPTIRRNFITEPQTKRTRFGDRSTKSNCAAKRKWSRDSRSGLAPIVSALLSGIRLQPFLENRKEASSRAGRLASLPALYRRSKRIYPRAVRVSQ
jgi:hypothetical protein